MNSDKLQVYIAGPWDGLVAALFLKAGFEGTRDISMADFVIFTGGADINPELYNEKPAGSFPPNLQRDEAEVEAFKTAKNWNIPMIGICRGAQLLNVLNGGSLWQDVDNHTTNHQIVDVRTNKVYTATSTHHQQMRPTSKARMLAVAFVPALNGRGTLSTRKKAYGVTQYPKERDLDAEVLFYPETNCLCFQPHPEYPGTTQTADYFWEIFKEVFPEDAVVNAQESA